MVAGIQITGTVTPMFGLFSCFEVCYDPFMIGEVLGFLQEKYRRSLPNCRRTTPNLSTYRAPLRGKARAPG
jgi:hypothetical protein